MVNVIITHQYYLLSKNTKRKVGVQLIIALLYVRYSLERKNKYDEHYKCDMSALLFKYICIQIIQTMFD
jgi:hypothetical protein